MVEEGKSNYMSASLLSVLSFSFTPSIHIFFLSFTIFVHNVVAHLKIHQKLFKMDIVMVKTATSKENHIPYYHRISRYD